jgi:hypothetical protein
LIQIACLTFHGPRKAHQRKWYGFFIGRIGGKVYAQWITCMEGHLQGADGNSVESAAQICLLAKEREDPLDGPTAPLCL